jgi:riboflavin kinase/FMN adenylyltransferase
VRRGAGRGRTLGFPTANLKPDRPLLLAAGVYAAHARWDGREAEAVVNIGYRPTFEESQYWVEAYLFDFAGDLYDRNLTVDFLYRIRAEMKFPGVEALTAQVRADMAEARRLLRAQPAG